MSITNTTDEFKTLSYISPTDTSTIANDIVALDIGETVELNIEERALGKVRERPIHKTIRRARARDLNELAGVFIGYHGGRGV